MRIDLLPALKDNYIFVAKDNGHAMVVDPGEAEPVAEFIDAHGLTLDLILATHHHADHIGGINELQRRYRSHLFGPSSLDDHGLTCDLILTEGSAFQFGPFNFTCMHLPGHTLDQMAYFCRKPSFTEASAAPILFCGDTLFSLGCGRLFEGSAAQMYESLGRIKQLPPETLICCGHEYTLRNMDFSLAYLREMAGPENSYNETTRALIARYEHIQAVLMDRRDRGEFTVPSQLSFELENNLFLKAGSVEEFTHVRNARNDF